jgi:Ni/Co efflux regulator RcnB
MQPQTQHAEFQGWQRLVGTLATEATHPSLPGTVVTGQATFEWLEDQRFLIQRSHYDHPEIPDAHRRGRGDRTSDHRRQRVHDPRDRRRHWTAVGGAQLRATAATSTESPMIPAAISSTLKLRASRRGSP